MTATTTPTNLKSAERVNDDWFDGAPASVPGDAVWNDMRIYRRLKCAGCGKPGMRAIPQHTASGRYRVLASCRTCRHREAC
jgi:hypothetical protein